MQPLTTEVQAREILDSDTGLDLAGPGGVRFAIRAEFLSDYLLERARSNRTTPIAISNAVIDGRLNLNDLTLRASITLSKCHLERLWVNRAKLASLRLHECSMEFLGAEELELSESLSIRECEDIGPILLLGAKVSNSVTITESNIRGDLLRPSVLLDHTSIDGGLRISHCKFKSESTLSSLRMSDVRIGRGVQIIECTIENDYGSGLDAQRIKCSNLQVGPNVSVTASDRGGAINLIDAEIPGNVSITRGIYIENAHGPAIALERAQIGGDVDLRHGFEVVGARERGAVGLRAAHINGQIDIRNATFTNRSGPAIQGDSLQVDGSILMTLNVAARSSSETEGALILTGAKIGDNLTLNGAHLENDVGPAFLGDGLRCNSLSMAKDFMAVGRGLDATVRLLSAQVDGQLSAFGQSSIAINCRDDRASLDLRNSRIGDLMLAPEFAARTLRPVGRGTSETLKCYPGIVDLDGCVYDSESLGLSARQWLALLRLQTPRYTPQPYRQLANVYLSEGNVESAKKILTSQQGDYARRGLRQDPELSRSKRLTTRTALSVLRATVGYGWRPWRALGWLAATTLLYTLLSVFVFAPHMYISKGGAPLTSLSASSAAPISASPRVTEPCSANDAVEYALSAVVPLVNFQNANRCVLTRGDSIGHAVTRYGSMLAAVVGWASATLFVAGYTGIVRKTS